MTNYYKHPEGLTVDDILITVAGLAILGLICFGCTPRDIINDTPRTYTSHFAYNDFVAKDQESLKERVR